MNATLDRALSWARLRFGGRTHLIEERRRVTFVDLDEEVTRRAEALRERGVCPGDRVTLPIANTAAHVAVAFGVWRAGGVLVPLNPRLGAPEMEAIASRSGARLAVRITPDGAIEIEERPAGAPEDADLAAIAYTSGTTGSPKGVEITHSNMMWAAAAVMHTRRDGPNAVAAMVSPIGHLPVFVSHYLARLLSGGTVVAASFDPDRLARMLAEHGITDLPLVPAMVAPLLERTAPAGLRLRKVTVGSALTPIEVKEALAARFPEAEIIEAYGQTESTDGLTMSVGREALERPGTVGRPHVLIPLAIRRVDGSFADPGEVGELVCQGPTVMRGYRDDPEATRTALRDGWLHTGDLGRMDEEGFVYVTGRLKEIIISGGENISPEEVEAALRDHPAVAEVAVFGLADARFGEQVAAAVVARQPVEQDALVEHVTHRLARFKRPRRIFFVDALPKTAAGKVRRNALRARFAGRPNG